MMKLFPVPASFKSLNSSRNFSSARWVIVPENSSITLKKRIIELTKQCSAGYLIPVQTVAGQPSAGETLIRMTRLQKIAEEGYQLTVEKQGSIEIKASSDSGFFYGMQTAVQLLKNPAAVPCCRIDDRPSVRERGFMLDISRCKVPTMETVKGLVKSLALLRYNSMQLYMEHTFAFAAHERVWSDFSPFTAEEIMELDAFCQEHFIELVPNLNSFGHMNRWLRHDEYRDLMESERRDMLYPCKKGLDFMESLYTELLPNFTAKRVNIGCDETWELGTGRSKDECDRRGSTQVYLEFLCGLAERAAKHGYSVEFWGDIIKKSPEHVKKLPAGITALEWGYEAASPYERDTRLFHDSGVEFLVCPGTSAWCSLSGRTTNMTGNISNALYYGMKNHARGMLMTDWGDCGHWQYYPVSWAGIAMGGGAAWNAKRCPETVQILPYGIALAFVPGPEGEKIGEFLLECGRLNDDFEHQKDNSTPYAWILMLCGCIKKSDLERFTMAEVNQALRHAKLLLAKLTAHPFTGQPLITAEIENMLRMSVAALIFMKKAIGGSWNRREWTDLMSHIISCHEKLWLSRNRPGGLHESSAGLRKAMTFDPAVWKKN